MVKEGMCSFLRIFKRTIHLMIVSVIVYPPFHRLAKGIYTCDISSSCDGSDRAKGDLIASLSSFTDRDSEAQRGQ
jgi:hypothetical protein